MRSVPESRPESSFQVLRISFNGNASLAQPGRRPVHDLKTFRERGERARFHNGEIALRFVAIESGFRQVTRLRRGDRSVNLEVHAAVAMTEDNRTTVSVSHDYAHGYDGEKQAGNDTQHHQEDWRPSETCRGSYQRCVPRPLNRLISCAHHRDRQLAPLGLMIVR